MKNALLIALAAVVGLETWILWLNREADWVGHPFPAQATAPAPLETTVETPPDPNELAAIAGQPSYQAFVDKAHRAQLLALATPFKMMLLEHQMMEGRFPQTWSELNVDAATLTSKDVFQVQLAAGEVVVLPRRTPGGWISLAASSAMGGMAVEWECRTNIDAFVDSLCRRDDRSFPPLEPAFDCDRAAGVIPQAICRDHDLMRQDRELARELEGLRSVLSPERVYRMDQQQQAFLTKRRRSCGNLQPETQRTCIEEETADRLRTLRDVRPAKG